jgi:hypothetical protein
VKRRRFAIALGVLAITAGGAVVASILFERLVRQSEPPARGSGTEPPAPAAALHVLATSGTVERSSAPGMWRQVSIGDELGAEDSVRTGGSSTAELGVKGRLRITVADATQITLREATSAVRRLRLSRGRIAVDYAQDPDRWLRIEDEAGRSVETKQARFGALATGTMLAVATEAGTVTLRAGGSAVNVGAGEQSAARNDRPPSRAEPIPGALLLKVAASAADLERDECQALAGAVGLASSVAIDGEPVSLDDDGRFVARARRRRGREAVLVTVTDALGRTAQRAIPCRDPKATVKDLSVRWKR